MFLIHQSRKRGKDMSEILEASLDEGTLKAFGKTIPISCRVRNEENGLRELTEAPLLSMPDEKPVMPRRFPKGTWQVTDRPRRRVSPEKRPYFIPTDAWQELTVWSVVDGHYGEPTGECTKDIGYGLHYSAYVNTNGCLKVEKETDLIFLVSEINKCFDEKRSVFVKVV